MQGQLLEKYASYFLSFNLILLSFYKIFVLLLFTGKKRSSVICHKKKEGANTFRKLTCHMHDLI